MDNIVQIMEEMGTEEIFVHADEAIYRKIVMITWLYDGKCENAIPLTLIWVGFFGVRFETGQGR